MTAQTTVIITGAASGIGKSTAMLFHRRGANVFCVDVNPKSLKKLRGTEFEGSSRCEYYVGDVSKREDVRLGLEKCLNVFGGVNVLVANAGIVRRSSFLHMTEQEWDDVIRVNLKGVFLWGQAVAHWMTDNNVLGSIVNISCIRSLVVAGDMANYAASKGGVSALTRAMAYELAPYGIRVNAVAPGQTMTPLTESRLRDPAVRAKTESQIPLGRLAEPNEIAELIYFLASENASYMTGSTVFADGGFTIS